jgi:hypothetical protein
MGLLAATVTRFSGGGVADWTVFCFDDKTTVVGGTSLWVGLVCGTPTGRPCLLVE